MEDWSHSLGWVGFQTLNGKKDLAHRQGKGIRRRKILDQKKDENKQHLSIKKKNIIGFKSR